MKPAKAEASICIEVRREQIAARRMRPIVTGAEPTSQRQVARVLAASDRWRPAAPEQQLAEQPLEWPVRLRVVSVRTGAADRTS